MVSTTYEIWKLWANQTRFKSESNPNGKSRTHSTDISDTWTKSQVHQRSISSIFPSTSAAKSSKTIPGTNLELYTPNSAQIKNMNQVIRSKSNLSAKQIKEVILQGIVPQEYHSQTYEEVEAIASRKLECRSRGPMRNLSSSWHSAFPPLFLRIRPQLQGPSTWHAGAPVGGTPAGGVPAGGAPADGVIGVADDDCGPCCSFFLLKIRDWSGSTPLSTAFTRSIPSLVSCSFTADSTLSTWLSVPHRTEPHSDLPDLFACHQFGVHVTPIGRSSCHDTRCCAMSFFDIKVSNPPVLAGLVAEWMHVHVSVSHSEQWFHFVSCIMTTAISCLDSHNCRLSQSDCLRPPAFQLNMVIRWCFRWRPVCVLAGSISTSLGKAESACWVTWGLRWVGMSRSVMSWFLYQVYPCWEIRLIALRKLRFLAEVVCFELSGFANDPEANFGRPPHEFPSTSKSDWSSTGPVADQQPSPPSASVMMTAQTMQ